MCQITPALRSIQQKLFVAVRESANALDEVWGRSARQEPGFDARRVLVLDGTDPDGAHIDMARIASFMDTPLGPPDDQALQAHEINHWLQHFQSP